MESKDNEKKIARENFINSKSFNPICYRVPSFRVCGCTVPCRIAVKNHINEPIEIIDGLYLGPVTSTFMIEKLIEKNINFILNVSDESYHEHTHLFTYLKINLFDEEKVIINRHFERTNRYIDLNISQGVLVHCRAGISRSVSFILAYLIWKTGKSYDECFEIVKQKRPYASPNEGFERQLREYALTQPWKETAQSQEEKKNETERDIC